MTHVWKRTVRGQPIIANKSQSGDVIVATAPVTAAEVVSADVIATASTATSTVTGTRSTVGIEASSEYEEYEYEFEEEEEEEYDLEVESQSQQPRRRLKREPSDETDSSYLVHRPSRTSLSGLQQQRFQQQQHQQQQQQQQQHSQVGSFVLSSLIVSLLIFLLCSSFYLVHRVNELQSQVESRPSQNSFSRENSLLDSLLDTRSTQKMRKILDSNVDQIASVRKVRLRFGALKGH